MSTSGRMHPSPCDIGEEPPAKCSRMEAPMNGRIIPIIGEEIRSEAVPLAEFYAARFEDKKKIGPFLKMIPLSHEEFDHLKRVDKQGRVLIQPAQKPLSSVVLEVLKELEMAESDVQAVPASRPLTSRQFDWAKEYWPTAFHPDKETESLLNGTFLSSDEKEMVCYWSGQALRVGCIVIQNNKELTRGSRTERLLGHPVITMVQNLAKCNRSNDDYLATGCDVYVKDEPCAMCAMALVHCRAARVFYCRNTRNGVLAPGKWQLHLEPAINHHYKVFHVEIEQQDEQSWTCGG